MLCIGHTLRFFTYISTSYPGTSMHCRPENVGKINPPSPQTLYEVFIGRVALAPGANCGDLLFRCVQGYSMALVVVRSDP